MQRNSAVQSRKSDGRTAHAPAAQPQLPSWHGISLGNFLPQPPQCLRSVVVSTQPPSHSEVPAGHPQEQCINFGPCKPIGNQHKLGADPRRGTRQAASGCMHAACTMHAYIHKLVCTAVRAFLGAHLLCSRSCRLGTAHPWGTFCHSRRSAWGLLLC